MGRGFGSHGYSPGRRVAMSWQAVAWAYSFSGAGMAASDKAVLLAIAQLFNEKRQHAWPSAATLARMTELNPRTVKTCLRRLEAAGLVETVARRNVESGAQTSNAFLLPLHSSRSERSALPGVDLVFPAPNNGEALPLEGVAAPYAVG